MCAHVRTRAHVCAYTPHSLECCTLSSSRAPAQRNVIGALLSYGSITMISECCLCRDLGLRFSQDSPRSFSSCLLCISFTAVWACVLSRQVRLLVTLWTIAHQAPLSMGFSRQEYWSGLPCPPPGDLPNLGIQPKSLTSPALVGSLPLAPLGKPLNS